MKTFLFLILVSTLLVPVRAQVDVEALNRTRLVSARVRTQTEFTHDYVDGRPSPRGYKSSVTEFDNRGNITRITNFDATGKTISMVVNQYDSRGNRVNFERFNISGENTRELRYSQRTVFDGRGNRTRDHGFDGSSQYNNVFTYDANGKLTEISYTTNGVVTERRQFSHTGNRTEVTVLSAGGAVTFKQVNTYDANGLLLSEVRTNPQGAVIHSLTMQYNSAGNVTEEVKRRENNALDYQKTFIYDRNRLIRIETTTAGGTKFIANEYQYNAGGGLTLESWRRNERTARASTNKYTYDARGLCTEKDSFFATHNLNSLYKYQYEFF